MSTPKEHTRLAQACNYCRSKKVKCDGRKPCGNCLDHQSQCVYSRVQRRRRRDHGGQASVLHSRREADNQTSNNENYGILALSQQHHHQSLDDILELTMTSMLPGERLCDLSSDNFHPPNAEESAAWAPATSTVHSPTATQGYAPMPTGGLAAGENPEGLSTPQPSDVDREETTVALSNINWEHHGPASWLSICSYPGLKWVTERSGTNKFDQIAHNLIMGWTKHLSLPQGTMHERTHELCSERAWKYTTAFFEHSHDSVLGVVYRPEFEARLHRFFEENHAHDDDVAWYALRNAVYATGCRCAASIENQNDFMEVQQESVQYFHNALSVQSYLLYMPSGLMAIQALVTMTSYAELLGSPAVEYMLCGSAARLAQSKGLHRQPSRTWKLSTKEVLHRNWLFWAIYCYQKNIALRSGRPSVLDDDDINCEIPDTIPTGSTIDIELFNAIIKHAQICSKIIKKLLSARAFSNPTETILRTIESLRGEVHEWQISLPTHLRPPVQSIPVGQPRNSQRKKNIIRLHYLYHSIVIALHSTLHYPWVSSILLNKKESLFQDHIFQSSKQVADAARQILVILRAIEPDIASPSLMVFYFPMLAVINMFIFILKYPTLKSAQSDLALLDVAAGHFGHVHLLTSSIISFPFCREVAVVADKALRKAASKTSDDVQEASHPSEPLLDSMLNRSDETMHMPNLNLNASPEDLFGEFSAAGGLISF